MPDVRYAIVTGAASGLGRAISLALAAQGWHIALADLNDAGSQETLALVTAAGGRGQVEYLDVTQPDLWHGLVQRLRGEWPALDLLVNNAGVACAGELGTIPLADWRWQLDTNLLSVIHGCHACVDWLKQNPRGAHIVNISSLAAVLAAPAMAPYNVAKAGVLAFSETCYAELRCHGVGVTVVCPGFFASDLLKTARFQQEEQHTIAEAYVRAARITADDVAQAILRAVGASGCMSCCRRRRAGYGG